MKKIKLDYNKVIKTNPKMVKEGGCGLKFILFIIFSFILSIFLNSCNQNDKITKNDLVVTCVITDLVIKQPTSILEIEPKFYYTTTCGEKIITNRDDVYHVGDTVKFVYKNMLKSK